MSWRRFVTLIVGLSVESRFVHALRDARERGGRADVIIDSDDQVEAFVASLGGG